MKKIRIPVLSLVAALAIFLAACGPLPAGADVNVSPDGQSASVEFSGVVESIAAAQWVIQGQTLLIGPATIIDPGIATGDLVQVHATVSLDGSVTAEKIETASASTPDASSNDDPSSTPSAGDEIEFYGLVDAIGQNVWTVAGQDFAVTPQTEIKGPIAAGDTVKVHALVGLDGSLTAREIERFDASMNGGLPLNLSAGEMEMLGVVEEIGAAQWTISGIVFGVDAGTEIEAGLAVGDPVKVEAVLQPDGSLLATEIKLPDSDDSSSSDDSSGLELEFTGVVEALGPDSITLGGKTFLITPRTEIEGSLIVGASVKIEAYGDLNGALTAREIKVLVLLDDSGNSGSGSDDHSSGSSTDEPDDDSDDDSDDD
jgi:hypothetical protein